MFEITKVILTKEINIDQGLLVSHSSRLDIGSWYVTLSLCALETQQVNVVDGGECRNTWFWIKILSPITCDTRMYRL